MARCNRIHFISDKGRQACEFEQKQLSNHYITPKGIFTPFWLNNSEDMSNYIGTYLWFSIEKSKLFRKLLSMKSMLYSFRCHQKLKRISLGYVFILEPIPSEKVWSKDFVPFVCLLVSPFNKLTLGWVRDIWSASADSFWYR